MSAWRRSGVKSLTKVLVTAFAAAALAACSGESSNEGAPKIADMDAERKRVSAEIKKRKTKKPEKVAAKSEKKDEKAGIVETAMGPVEVDYVYVSHDRRDPFRSAFWAQPVRVMPRGPLEHYELGQLAVTAIVWDSDRPRALVSDPGGAAYVVKEGSKIGKNDGLVIHIGDNLVLVKETYVDFAGDQSTKDVEMRIRTSQGG